MEQVPTANNANVQSSILADSFVKALLVVVVVKIVLLLTTGLDLAPDESYYWEWSRNLDWSYYSKGPIVALLIRAGCWVGGDTLFGVKCTFVFCGTAFLIFLYASLRELVTPRLATILSLFFLYAPFYATLGLGATTDPPALCFLFAGIWVATKYQERQSAQSVCSTGLLLGLAALTKLTCIVVAAVWLGFVIYKSSSWLMKCCAALGVAIPMLPLLYWNYTHQWVNVIHNAGHLSSSTSPKIGVLNLTLLLLSQFALLGPLQSVLLVSFARSRIKLLCACPWGLSAMILAVTCLFVSLTRPVYANWPMPIYPLLMLSLSRMYAQQAEEIITRYAVYLRYARTLMLAVLFVTMPFLMGETLGLPAKKLPTKKLLGWSNLGRMVDEVLADGEFVYVSRYDIGSSIAFYSTRHPLIVCGALKPRRMNQYDLWNTWSKVQGSSALIVLEDKSQAELLGRDFAAVTYLGAYDMQHRGSVIKQLHLFRGVGFYGKSPVYDRVT